MERGNGREKGTLREGMERGDDAVEGSLRHGCGREAMPVPGGTACHHSAVAEALAQGCRPCNAVGLSAAWRLSQYNAIPGHMPG